MSQTDDEKRSGGLPPTPVPKNMKQRALEEADYFRRYYATLGDRLRVQSQRWRLAVGVISAAALATAFMFPTIASFLVVAAVIVEAARTHLRFDERITSAIFCASSVNAEFDKIRLNGGDVAGSLDRISRVTALGWAWVPGNTGIARQTDDEVRRARIEGSLEMHDPST